MHRTLATHVVIDTWLAQLIFFLPRSYAHLYIHELQSYSCWTRTQRYIDAYWPLCVLHLPLSAYIHFRISLFTIVFIYSLPLSTIRQTPLSDWLRSMNSIFFIGWFNHTWEVRRSKRAVRMMKVTQRSYLLRYLFGALLNRHFFPSCCLSLSMIE